MESPKNDDEKGGGTNSSPTQTNEQSNPPQVPLEATEAQMQCIKWARDQEWDLIKEYAEEYGQEVLLGVYNYTDDDNVDCHESVLYKAAWHKNVEMVKFVLDAGFDDKRAMNASALISMMEHGDNTTILRMLLEHGLDPNMDRQLEGFADRPMCTLLMVTATVGCHINHAITLLDHGANVNKAGVGTDGSVGGALACSIRYGRHDLCKLFLSRGAIPTTDDVELAYNDCLAACQGTHSHLGSDLARAMMATFIHLGKPDQDVVEEVHNKLSAYHDPIIAQITKQYIQGRPFCCEVCEALTAKGRDRLFMCPCRTIAYCSRDCQVKNWKNKHKDECQGALNDKGESEAMVKERKKTGKGAAGGAGGEGGGSATGEKKGRKKGKKGRGKK